MNIFRSHAEEAGSLPPKVVALVLSLIAVPLLLDLSFEYGLKGLRIVSLQGCPHFAESFQIGLEQRFFPRKLVLHKLGKGVGFGWRDVSVLQFHHGCILLRVASLPWHQYPGHRLVPGAAREKDRTDHPGCRHYPEGTLCPAPASAASPSEGSTETCSRSPWPRHRGRASPYRIGGSAEPPDSSQGAEGTPEY